jgi:hypothetical protein
MIATRAILLFMALVFIGCSYTPTPPSALPSSGPQILRGTVYPDGTTTVWARSPQGAFTLAISDEKPAGVPLGIAVGGPLGPSGTCDTEDPIDMQAGSAARDVPAPESGLYCINVIDTGSVTAKSGVDFALTVTAR